MLFKRRRTTTIKQVKVNEDDGKVFGKEEEEVEMKHK